MDPQKDLESLIDNLEKDILCLTHDMMTQAQGIVFSKEKRALRLQRYLDACSSTSQGDHKTTEFWEHRKFIADQDLYWSQRELAQWRRILHNLRVLPFY